MHKSFHQRQGVLLIVLLTLFTLLPWYLPRMHGQASAAPASVQEKLNQLNKLSGEERQRFLEKQAAKEGKIVMYSSGDPDIIRLWNDLFKKKYPQINAQFVRMTTRDVLQKGVHESEAGRPVADILNLPAAQLAVFLKKNLITRYVSPESNDFDPELKDANGFWTTAWYNPEVVGFNTDLIKEGDVPTTLVALKNPALRGKLGRTSLGNRWTAAVLKVEGESEGMKLLREIAAQEPRIYKSNTALGNALSSGQVAIAFDIHISNVTKLMKRGAPVRYVVPQPLFVYGSYFALPKDTPHPYAAALVYDWLLSKEGGQSIFKEHDHIGPRKDTSYANEEVIKAAKTIVSYSPELLAVDKLEKFSKIFEDIFIRK